MQHAMNKFFHFKSNEQNLTVTIPEQQKASYGLYTWPCASVLAWYIWCNKEAFVSKTVLEIGAGTCLPGIVAAKVSVIGLTWGLFHSEIFGLKQLDFIIGSDCFYDPEVFEKILVTVAYLLEENPTAKFIFSYQERSADWSIRSILLKWGLKCKLINTENLDDRCLENFSDFLSGHIINLYEITKS
ncbi:histone-arginine methyltransferase METTL23-like isoform X2 [Artemia franciscana]|uniref:histone-arginine methyltransferase METTL23-like isoform X2 n=1 Tax=Artemia franciscana TaxID=6661 RepID=UPI0032DBF092